MAGLRICCAFCDNRLPAGKYELASRAPTIRNGINTPILPVFCISTSASTPVPAPLKDTFINVDLQRAIKLALKLFIQN